MGGDPSGAVFVPMVPMGPGAMMGPAALPYPPPPALFPLPPAGGFPSAAYPEGPTYQNPYNDPAVAAVVLKNVTATPAAPFAPAKVSENEQEEGQEAEGKVSEKDKANSLLPPKLNRVLTKTKICDFYLAGKCRYGKSCTFAHSVNDLQLQPNLAKTKLCNEFRSERGCPLGNSCPFAHGQTELRSTKDFFKTSPCIWYRKGNCKNGTNCRFAHGEEELLPMQSSPDDDTAAAAPIKSVAKTSVMKVAQQLTPAQGGAVPISIMPAAVQPSEADQNQKNTTQEERAAAQLLEEKNKILSKKALSSGLQTKTLGGVLVIDDPEALKVRGDPMFLTVSSTSATGASPLSPPPPALLSPSPTSISGF